MLFDFDINKSKFNKKKHGIDFHEAQELWKDYNAIRLPAKLVQDEKRYLIIGKIKNKLWAVIITYRNKTRIISARRARNKEAMLYEKYKR
ncbi:BrnT family toxin [Candidatus Margulisiibacteriota bacterium]